MAHRTTADADDGNQILSRNGRAISSQTNLVPTVDDKSRLFMNQLFTPTSQTNLKGGWLWASRSTRESRNSPKKTETNRLGDRIFQVGKNSIVRANFMNPSVEIAIEILNRLFATHSALQQNTAQYFTYTNHKEYRVAA